MADDDFRGANGSAFFVSIMLKLPKWRTFRNCYQGQGSHLQSRQSVITIIGTVVFLPVCFGGELYLSPESRKIMDSKQIRNTSMTSTTPFAILTNIAGPADAAVSA